MLAAGCPVVGREMLETGFPNDWLDQTMSYQLIQTTSFAMHPRLVDYFTVALVWMNCSSRLVSCDCFLLIVMSLLMSSSLSSPAGLLTPADLSSSADHDIVTDDIIIDGPLRSGSTWPPPDYEQLTQLWTFPLLIQLSFTMINQTSC
ncbi:hypothetical protein F511_32380 [Dorcoceras hygrometricum]|uniref:Uncharacterized protein n=1 Tax=Dorcoceras hygrometricum TaxID=472368 RepID=A0A2Z7C7Q6_9LAMI|nr:hypothetical protein F511_32380 [Dorcoceras hygrometricum]